MNVLDPNESTEETKVEYVVQYGRIGGPVSSPMAYWSEHYKTFRTLAEAQEVAARPIEVSKFMTWQIRIVKRTVVTYITPMELTA